MAERPPPLTASSYETVVDRQIRLAQERGEFDDLPGAGKPLPGAGRPHDELAWVKGLLEREGLSTEALLPTSIRLRKEIDALPASLAELPSEWAVREVVGDLNRRIVDWFRNPVGPPVRLGRVDADDAVTQWARARRRVTDERSAPQPERPAPPRGGRWLRRRLR